MATFPRYSPAAKYDHLDIVKWLYQYGASLDNGELIDSCNGRITALAMAVYYFKKPILEWLIEQGVNVNELTTHGTALHCVVEA